MKTKPINSQLFTMPASGVDFSKAADVSQLIERVNSTPLPLSAEGCKTPATGQPARPQDQRQSEK